ncbi:MAG: hypothetical protein HC907_35240 [Richelia sp. SM1_7_0]|nr:hypothetical protein [Richelia sp. SM1_7_0]NJR15728.1 hypothetical protein [Calothrix sp. CSU_2_0]
MNISQAVKQIWERGREKTPSLPTWKELPILKKQEFICEVWLITYLIQKHKEKRMSHCDASRMPLRDRN